MTALGLLAAVDLVVGTRLLLCRRFLLLLAVFSVGTLLFDGYLTARPVLHYGWRYLSGVQIGTIPLEDFGYGVSLVGVAVFSWEIVDRAGRRRG